MQNVNFFVKITQNVNFFVKIFKLYVGKDMQDFSDFASALIFNKSDNTMLTVIDSSNEYWIPSSKVLGGQSWFKNISSSIRDIFNSSPNVSNLLRLSKLWLPSHPLPFVFHAIFLILVDDDLKRKSKSCTGKFKGKIRWLNESELKRLLLNNTLKSPELMEYFLLVKGDTIATNFYPDEATCNGNIFEINDDVIVKDKFNTYGSMVVTSEISREVQEVLLKEFIGTIFPACYMNFSRFGVIAKHLGWEDVDVPNLFRAADINNRNGLSFREFLYFLVAGDPATTHSGVSAEIRCIYLFKFYDKDGDFALNNDEFFNLVKTLRKGRRLSTQPADIKREIDEILKQMRKAGPNFSIRFNDFMQAASSEIIKGTSLVHRATKSISEFYKALCEKQGRSDMDLSKKQVKSIGGQVINTRLLAPARDISGGQRIFYDIALHSVRIEPIGNTVNIDQIHEIHQAMSSSALEQPPNEQSRRISIDLFNQQSTSNEILKGVRYLAMLNSKMLTPDNRSANFSWGKLNAQQFSKNFILVCQHVKEILKNESRLLELSSPVYIMGDFHGNVADLLLFERMLWTLGPGLCPCNLLFLGDFVDRGPFGIEVLGYLFSYKLQSPKKVTLLRGNHEIREVQKMFSFYSECIQKFGDKTGKEVWAAINNTMDYLPLAATIDKKVFCCHGGVPPPWLCPVISAINDIPPHLFKPDTQSSLAWEMMWNDPVRTNKVTDEVAMELLANEGFAFNSRRGTGHVFSTEALERFLKANQLSHFVRAHEVVTPGIMIQQKGKLLTVFSSSGYCGGDNKAACILADQGKLRILRIEKQT